MVLVNDTNWNIPKRLVLVKSSIEENSLLVDKRDKSAIKVAEKNLSTTVNYERIQPSLIEVENKVTAVKLGKQVIPYRNNKFYNVMSCSIEIDGEVIQTEIELNSVLDLVLTNTSNRGLVRGNFIIGKYRGMTGLLPSNTPALNKPAHKQTKAWKYKPGVRYYDTRYKIDVVCLGKLYYYFDDIFGYANENEIIQRKIGFRYRPIPKECSIIVPTNLVKSYNTVEEAINCLLDITNTANIMIINESIKENTQLLTIGEQLLNVDTEKDTQVLEKTILKITRYILETGSVGVTKNGILLPGLTARKNQLIYDYRKAKDIVKLNETLHPRYYITMDCS